ncbi:MAG TPA: hypothetical protein VGF95_05505 [Solirubrobacteraceae bacterium]|jgi:hypothetical protein
MSWVSNGMRTGGCAAAIVLAGVLAAMPSSAQAEPTCENGAASFTYSNGEQQCYEVPAGVNEIHITAIGGRGGEAADGEQIGGYGAVVGGYLPVSPGEMLYIEVGQSGQFGGSKTAVGGGGKAGSDSGSGGGASDVRTCSIDVCASLTAEDSRLIVAGGGGGSGLNGGHGGNAGESGLADGAAGSVGAPAFDGSEEPGGGGGGGTLTAGGEGGSGGKGSEFNGLQGSAGTRGQGGAAAPTGGGGGGGYYGGGGGGEAGVSEGLFEAGHGGGGGGSSYAAPYITGVTIVTAKAGEAPKVVIEPTSIPIGPEGPQGQKGEEGKQGEEGDKGQPGPVGEEGGKGAIGEEGAKGATGQKGKTGAIGTAGVTGEAGAAGANGATGETGPAGATGASGAAGLRGRKGTVKLVICASEGEAGKLRCKVKRGSSPFKLDGGSGSVAASLSRDGKLYARGFELYSVQRSARAKAHRGSKLPGDGDRTAVTLELDPDRALAPGVYRLTLVQAGQRSSRRVRIGAR